MSVPLEHSLRPMASDCSLLTQADGSCVFNIGDTSVMAAVYGPTEARGNRERLDKCRVDLVYKPKTGLPSCVDRLLERVVRGTCETAILAMLHPRTAINIILQEVQDCGSLLSCCINAACQALLDAAVPLKFTVAAVTCVLTADGDVVVDPDRNTESPLAELTFVFDSSEKKLVTCHSTGCCTSEQFQTCLLLCRTAAENVFEFYRESMTRKLERMS